MITVEALLLGHLFWAWLAVAAVLLTVEVITGSGWLLWPAGSAAAVSVVALIAPAGLAPEAALFASMTIVTTYLGRRFLTPPSAAAHDVNDPSARLVGRQGTAIAPFSGGRGRVFVDGKEWAAETDSGAQLGVGARVEVVALIGGARLKVRGV